MPEKIIEIMNLALESDFVEIKSYFYDLQGDFEKAFLSFIRNIWDFQKAKVFKYLNNHFKLKNQEIIDVKNKLIYSKN
jgi:hypothetical protein